MGVLDNGVKVPGALVVSFVHVLHKFQQASSWLGSLEEVSKSCETVFNYKSKAWASNVRV